MSKADLEDTADAYTGNVFKGDRVHFSTAGGCNVTTTVENARLRQGPDGNRDLEDRRKLDLAMGEFTAPHKSRRRAFKCPCAEWVRNLIIGI